MAASLYDLIAAADAALSPLVADPGLAAVVLNGQTATAVLSVAADDVRAILWRTKEYGRMDALLQAGRRADFSGYPTPLVAANNADLYASLATAFSFMNSGQTIGADQADSWKAITDQFAVIAQSSKMAATTLASIVALRSSTVSAWPKVIISDDVISARKLKR